MATTLVRYGATQDDRNPYLTLTGTDLTGGAGKMTMQLKGAAGNDLAEKKLVRTWIADADWSEPDAQTDFSVGTGEEFDEVEANADYLVIADATGEIEMDIDAGGAKTVYVMAKLGDFQVSEQLDITA